MHCVTTAHGPLLPTGDWHLDLAHSRIAFAIGKLGFGTVRGRFHDATATISVDRGRMTADGSVAVASIDTGSTDRDAHLRAFFCAAEHPLMVFTAQRSEALEDGWQLAGALTVRGVTRAIELCAHSAPSPDPERRWLVVTGAIDRRDFGLVWGTPVEATGVVSTTVRLELELELVHTPNP